MELRIEKDASEIKIRKALFDIFDIPLGSTHVEFSGDISFVENSVQLLDARIKAISPYPSAKMTGYMVLSDGDGTKIVNSNPIYQSMHVLGNGSTFVVGPDVYLEPGCNSLVSESIIGDYVFISTTTKSKIIGVDKTTSTYRYLLDTSIVINPGDDFWFNKKFSTGETTPDSISLITIPIVAPERPTALMDVRDFWKGIRDVWDIVGSEDKEQIERAWMGNVHTAGNLMQRLYELDAYQNVFDSLIYRKETWATVTSGYRKYIATGEVSSSDPTSMVDNTRRPFLDSVTDGYGSSNTDVDSNLTIDGRFYNIAAVNSIKSVELDLASLGSAKGLTYSIGGELNSDLSSKYKFKDYARRSKAVILDSEKIVDLGAINIESVKVDALPLGGRVRAVNSGVADGITKLAFPTRLYSSIRKFTRSNLGTNVDVGGAKYRVRSVSADGDYLDLYSASFTDAVGLEYEFVQGDYSDWFNGKTVAASNLFEEVSVETPFVAEDVGRKIFVSSGTDSGQYTITEFVSSNSVRLNKTLTTSNTSLTWLMPSDLVVDLTTGMCKRIPFGMIADCSQMTISYAVKVLYRVKVGVETVELPVLQETVEQATDEAYDYVSLTNYDELFLGHKSLLTLELVTDSGVSLTQGTDYTVDMDSGVAVIPPSAKIAAGGKFIAEMTYKPTYLEEGIGFFLEEDGYIYFRENPRVNLWAPEVYINKEDPYKQFGSLINFYQENSSVYYLSLLSLWITYWTGPKPSLIERGVNILMGLPFAFTEGTVTSVSLRRIELGSRWVVAVTDADGNIEQYQLPNGLDPYVSIGEKVEKFGILSGFRSEYTSSGSTIGRSFFDRDSAPFDKNAVGGKIHIPVGVNAGTYSITQFEKDFHVVLNGDLNDESSISYVAIVSAVRLFDMTSQPDFIRDNMSETALAKYYTENTTATNRELAKSLLRRHLFLCQISSEAFNNLPDINQISQFLRDVSPEYTDFILQIIVDQEDEFSITDEGGYVSSFIMDLTSTISWWASLLPSSADPFTSVVSNHSYPSSKDGETSAVLTLDDTENSPFTAGDVGSYIWVGGAWRFYKGGSVSTVSPNSFYAATAYGPFSATDVGKQLNIPQLNINTKITAYIGTHEVEVEDSIGLLAVGLEFEISHEDSQGVYEITSFVSTSSIGISSTITAGKGILYSKLRPEYSLDEEAISIYESGEVKVYDSLRVLLETITF